MRNVTSPTLIALALLAAWPAAAQLNPLGPNSGQAGGTGGLRPPAPASAPVVPPPEAVPGAKARPDSVTPTTRGSADLPPTEALFDAINRGDIASARDAIGRGADLDSTNMLGLTPIELSVDLARNDISFLLLSLRGGSGAAHATPQAATAAAAATPATKAAERRAALRAAMPPMAITREARPATFQAAPLFAGNGGAAVPSAGFLGFDPHR